MNALELFDPFELQDMQLEGYVRVQHSPDGMLHILNYTDKAAYDRVWNDVTLNARGLIVDNELNIVARPIPKFFNLHEPGSAQFDLEEHVEVFDKLDGSLGISYFHRDRWHIATRGSFTSDQAIMGTMILNTRYLENIEALSRYKRGWTAMFEIIYPANRIVVDYGDVSRLVYLGHVEHATGRRVFDASFEWPDVAEHVELGYMMFAETFFLIDRENREGVVVSSVDGLRHVKIKQEDYIARHRIMTNLSPRRIWEYASVLSCVDSDPRHMAQRFQMSVEEVLRIVHLGVEGVIDLLSVAPEEFLKQILDEMRDIAHRAVSLDIELTERFKQLQEENSDTPDWKLIKENFNGDEQHVLFSYLNGTDRWMTIFKMLRP